MPDIKALGRTLGAQAKAAGLPIEPTCSPEFTDALAELTDPADMALLVDGWREGFPE